jgi:uncharacterized protein (UPF0335 family)
VTAGGSIQLRRFRIAIRDGMTVEDAAAHAPIMLAEAKLTIADDAKFPPQPEAYELPTPAPVIGHNSGENTMTEDSSAAQLRLLIERAERLLEERKGISDDIRDVFAEAKSTGFDVPTMKWAIKERAIERQRREETQALRETYGVQLGLF